MKNKTKNMAKGYSKNKWLLAGLPVVPVRHRKKKWTT
jgi:hypothetical protein